MKKIQKTFLILLLILFNFSGRIFASGFKLRLFSIPKEYKPNLPLIKVAENILNFLARYYDLVKPTEEEIQKARKCRLGIDQRLAHKEDRFAILTAFNNLDLGFNNDLIAAQKKKEEADVEALTTMLEENDDLKKILNLI